MTEIRFYHLTHQPLTRALPQLLEKSLARGMRAVVMAGSPERVEALNAALWTYGEGSFLPHGSAADGFAARQPIWLTAADENPNGATLLMLTDGAKTASLSAYELVCEIFDGKDDAATEAARARWKEYMAAGHTLTYWQQGETGWEKKNQ